MIATMNGMVTQLHLRADKIEIIMVNPLNLAVADFLICILL